MIRVFVVGEVRLYREGLATLLGQAGLEVVGTAADVASADAVLEDSSPEVVLLDVAVADGIATLRRLAERLPSVPVVAFGVTGSNRDVVACAEAGARGYVTRDQTSDELVEVLEGAARGEAVCSPQIAAALMQRVAALAPSARGEGIQLTRRELEIAGLVEEGLSNKEIARRLVIEVATVKSHVHNILGKLEVRRRSDAAAWLRRRPELRQLR
jgi:two-component system nitrate/nitrite response regulator NarL